MAGGRRGELPTAALFSMLFLAYLVLILHPLLEGPVGTGSSHTDMSPFTPFCRLVPLKVMQVGGKQEYS